MANCNAVIYRVLYSNNTKSRDLILKIASFCQQFSLYKVFISLDDVQRVLLKLSPQIIEAFDNILTETKYTSQVLALNTSPDMPFVSFKSGIHKINHAICGNEVKRTLDHRRVSEESRMTNSVTVKMMDLRWMKRKDKCFLDLVQILDRISNKTILETSFMNSLVDAFWHSYSRQIMKKQFLPSLAY